MMIICAIRRWAALAALLVPACAWAAAGDASSSLAPQASYAWVDGDSDKFRAHHWLEDGLDGGVREFKLSQDDMGNDWSILAEGHALAGKPDYAFDLTMRREGAAFFHLDFRQFRKYYDSTGGVYPLFTKLNGVDSNRDLYLDIGRLGLTYGVTPDNWPDLTIGYEFEYKQGVKSRLSWASVQEGSVTKKIAPSWQEINEDVHVFDLTLEDVWSGTGWKIEQSWEKAFSHNTRREINLADAPTASLNKLRDQETAPSSNVLNTMVELERWLIKDKLHGAAGYRYQQIENTEVENIYEMTSTGVIQNFTNPEQIRNAVGANLMALHAVASSLMWVVNPDWTLIAKVKIEDTNKRSSSDHPADRSPAATDGVIDQNEVSETSNGARRTGQALSLRFSGIPRAAFYNDVEFEQIESSLQENRQSSSGGEVFARQTDGYSYRGTETFGFRWFASDAVRLNAHYRFRRENADYDDQFETDPAATGAKSAFVDAQNEMLNEVAARLSVRICRSFEPALRYQLRQQDFTTRFEANPLNITSTALSHIYTLDLPLQPSPALSLVPSFQWQEAETRTPAEEQTPTGYPKIQSDVWTAMVAADYAVNAEMSVTSSFQYQSTDNFNDVSATTGSVPYGSDYDAFHCTIGVRWAGWKKGVAIEPKYGFYHYDPNDQVETGEYDAHVAWLGVTIDWA